MDFDLNPPAPRPPKKFNPHPFAYHQELEVEVVSLTNMGQGVARVDGWVVFVPFALPGERVRCRIYRNDKNFSESDLLEVLVPSADRVSPRCKLFGICGGCQYQHLSYAAQLLWKQRQVQELMSLHAGVSVPVEPVFASPVEYAYRSKITPHFEAPRDGKIGDIGFLKVGRGRSLVDTERCEIATEAINAQLTKARALVRANPSRYKKGATLLLRDADGQVHTEHKAAAVEVVGDLRLTFFAGDFFQNNPYILPQFVDYAVQEARKAGAVNLIDAYCGSGLFGLSAARHFSQVLGIEVSDTSVEQANRNAAANGITNAVFRAGKAEAIFENVDLPAVDTAVLIDPPRAGCDELFLQQLFAYGPRSVVYVSCNPATQIRDLKHFAAAGWQVTRIQPFDLFPQTKHLECVVTLEKKPSSISYRSLRGAELEPYLDALGQLRISVFREWPYLYDGNLEYERDYLRTYSKAQGSLVCLAFDGEKPIGATTCVPLAEEGPEFQKPFLEAGRDVSKVCYFGESILLPEYRGRGIGKEFFRVREAHAASLGLETTAFCAVDRDAGDERRPEGYRALDGFWESRGYEKQPQLQAHFTWLEVGKAEETKKSLTFWTRAISKA
jgi:tRNA/tmRNA/rRNA uracil-C5-methylase (TrmA/RlmC/RlmD family)/GNAT superfamily N-acetyltransferase